MRKILIVAFELTRLEEIDTSLALATVEECTKGPYSSS